MTLILYRKLNTFEAVLNGLWYCLWNLLDISIFLFPGSLNMINFPYLKMVYHEHTVNIFKIIREESHH